MIDIKKKLQEEITALEYELRREILKARAHGDRITVTGAPARGGSHILQATELSFNGKPLFSRPAVELSRDAVLAYEK